MLRAFFGASSVNMCHGPGDELSAEEGKVDRSPLPVPLNSYVLDSPISKALTPNAEPKTLYDALYAPAYP